MGTQCLLLGNPNSGKSSLFNQLTGLSAKVSNYPGVTIDIQRSRIPQWNDSTLVDLPGVYSLKPLSPDESITFEKLNEIVSQTEHIIFLCLIDSNRLERSEALVRDLRAFSKKNPNSKIVYALTMSDEFGGSWSAESLTDFSEKLGGPVYPVSSKTGEGLNEMRLALGALCKDLQTTELPNPAVPKNVINKKFLQQKIDRIVFHRWWGGLLFLVLMLVLFQSIFTWATPFMDSIELVLGKCSALVSAVTPQGLIRSFFQDAIISGIGSFLVFMPQIFILTFLIALLEDSGYLARAAVLCHRPLKAVGLTGKSFGPGLSGFACAIPAIMAARSIDSPWRRKLTMLVIPLLTCSARLPVYGLLVAAIIPPITLFGPIGLQGFSFFLLYAFGIVLACLVSFLLDKFSKKEKSELDVPFILELPPYRLPQLGVVLKSAWLKTKSFVVNAGGIIFMTTVVVWGLGVFPLGSSFEDSWLSRMGQWLTPVFSAMGVDWKVGVAILTSFLAREVFVGTLGTLFGLENPEAIAPLSDELVNSGMDIAAGVSLLLFYAIAMQCVSTLAVLKKELGSWKTPLRLLLGYNMLAYVISVSSYQILSAVL